MGKINKLQPEVFNMIAAGEVVERPASIVKELVENSIDAGAKRIDVSIVEGGIKKIVVSDDGTGILPEDMILAFTPHATSKIKDFEDIDYLSTLGFRGEALASIASVAEVTLTTCPKDGSPATLQVKAGEVISQGFGSRSQGTTVEVQNLFFNTPARLKFLKKSSSEAGIVKDTVEKLMLSNPEIAISLTIDGKQELKQEGGSLLDSIYSVYDTKTIKGLMEVNAEYNGIRIYGYISRVDLTKPNRTYQTIIINGRYVSSQVIQTAVEQAYSGFLMKRCYPIYVLNIVMPFDQLDVNVHPRKAEVRFANQQMVFSAVYHVVNNRINESTQETLVNLTNANSEPKPEKENFEQIKINTSKFYMPPIRQKPDILPNLNSNEFKPMESDLDKSIANYSLNTINEKEEIESTLKKPIYNYPTNLENQPVFDGKIIGQVFSTYILVEKDDMAYLIDQHAAHERILYEKIKKNLDKVNQQLLLVPYTMYLSGEEADYFNRIMPKLNSMGFDIQKEGSNKVTFYAVPDILASIDIKKFMGGIFEDMISDEDLSMELLVKDKISQQACKAAIKGGYEFSNEQIQQVITALLDENGNLPAKCPHGRPTVIAFSKKDIEKMFKRIL